MANYYGVGRTNYFKVKDPDLLSTDHLENTDCPHDDIQTVARSKFGPNVTITSPTY